jgi:N-acetyl-anhydromuramyl-L-alanine amidase AmpD
MSSPVDVWVGYPRSYTKGRMRAAQYVTLHYTAGSEGPTSAENGAAYDKSRTDGTSCHAFVDSAGLPCREVPDGDRSHSALWHGNEIGIHIEICGTRQTRAQWLDNTSMATLDYAAALVADICKRHGFPLKRLSVSETRAAYYAAAGSRPKGINDHATITAAYPEDGGDHTDVGPEFPWDVFMDLVREASEDGMDAEETCDANWNTDGVIKNVEGMSDFPANQFISGRTLVARGWEQSKANAATLARIEAVAKANAEALARIEAAIAAGPLPAPVEGKLSGSVTFTPDA